VSNRSYFKASFISNKEIKAAMGEVSTQSKENKASEKSLTKTIDFKEEKRTLDVDSLGGPEDIRVQYGLMGDQHVGGVDYGKLFSYLDREGANPEDIYQDPHYNHSPLERVEEDESLLMSDTEAQETIQEHLKAAIFSDTEGLSSQDAKKLEFYIMENPGKFKLLEQQCSLRTGNVSYGQLYN